MTSLRRRPRDWLVSQIPMGMLELDPDNDFLVRFASIFQELATTLLAGADNVPNLVDPTIAPDAMVRFLGSWIGLATIDSSLPETLQRRIVREFGQILAWRGTKRGLRQFLELLSGAPAEIEESGGIFAEGEAGARNPFVRMRVRSTGWATEDDLVALVHDWVPANVEFELLVGHRRLWPSGSDGKARTP
jgi:phage tail-like protein